VNAADTVYFSDLRDDWYRGADLMARLIHRAAHEETEFIGFPASWIPLFVHFGARWRDAIAPPEYRPLFSDLPVAEIARLARRAAERGQSRTFVESVAALDPLLADVLHKLDRRRALAAAAGAIAFTGWQSYGRPEVLDLEDRILAHRPGPGGTAVLLPCARKRPYRLSKAHRRLWRGLDQAGVGKAAVDQVVISSLGVIPEPFWEDPIVVGYDSGVPDIYRVLRLMRAYFGPRRYDRVIDCLEFEPYRDCLRIVAREGLVGAVAPGPARRIRTLPRP
jgi:predicted RNA-binding protein